MHQLLHLEETAPITIGLQKGYYSVSEDIGLLQVCVEVESGDIAGKSILLNYTTIDGSAKGIYHNHCSIVIAILYTW